MTTQHTDSLSALNKHSSIAEKLHGLHQTVMQHHPFIARVAVALYDANSDILKTFLYSSADPTPLKNYEARLSETLSLHQLSQEGQPRVIHDLIALSHDQKAHTQALLKAGFRSSYTLPMIMNESFFGFVFFNAKEPNVFNERVMSELDMIGHMITLMIYNERSNIRTLVATVKSALDMTHSRDPETGNHLERMSRYTRIIALALAQEHQFDDAYIEHIYLFSPLHDLGKIKTPDHILLKQGKLSDDEFEVMRKHPSDGKDLIDALLKNYGLSGVGYVEMLRNIANHHHEFIDGSGYPSGLRGNEIPVEARIVAVADIFDALTSERPYKKAWSNEKAAEKLLELRGHKLDPQCVDALLAHMDEVVEIQQQFRENGYG